MSTIYPFQDCDECGDYIDRRGEVVKPHIVSAASRRVMTPRAVAVEFMRGVHSRHLAGLSLEVSS